MAEPAAPDGTLPPLPDWGRFGNPAGAIYGTIVTAGVLAAENGSHHSVWVVLASAFATLVVFWLAHAYTDVIGHQIEAGRAVRHALGQSLRDEAPIVEAVVVPAVAMTAAHAFGADTGTAVTIGLILCVAELIAWSYLASTRLRLTWRQSVPYIVVTTLLGVGIILLKFAIH